MVKGMQLDSDLMKRLAKKSTAIRTEADIQSDIRMLLLSTPELIPSAEKASMALTLEEQVADGTRRRIDIALGSTVIKANA